jgi:putative intracellular protease/amidase
VSKKILMIISEKGYWGEELIGPLETFDKAGYTTVFATPNGNKPYALPPSVDPTYIDPPLGKSVTSPEVAEKVKALQASDRLNNPLSIAEMVPERPYVSLPTYLRDLEAYNHKLDELQEKLAEYDALIIVGGSGPTVDLANNGRVHDIILAFKSLDKPIGAECYGVACLAFARNWEGRESIIKNKRVTGHCKEYDYKDGHGVMKGTDPDSFHDLNFGPPPYPLEYILRDATAPEGRYIGNYGHDTSVVVDWPFVTGRSTPDSYLTGQKMVEMLEKGLRRYGW